jgi:hypothetical protein
MCGEPHYLHDFPMERTKASESAVPTTMGDMGKAHRIHAAVNNCQAEHQLTMLETSGTFVDQTLVFDSSRCYREFLSGAVLKKD